MKPATILNTLLGLSVIAMTLGTSSNTANAQATLTAYYTFEGGTPGDASDTTNYFDSAPGGTADHLTGFFQPELSSTVTGNAKGSAQSAVFDGSSKLRTDSYSTDLGPDPNAFTIMFWIKASDIDQENSSTRLMHVRKTPGGGNATNPAWSFEGFGNDGSRGDRMDLRKWSTVLGGGGFSPTIEDGSTGALANTGQEELWHHVAVVIANSGYPDDASNDAYSAVFFNGVRTGLDREADQNGLPVGNTDGMLIIGGDESLNNGSRDFTGLLDEVALYAGVVSGDAIASVASGVLRPDDDLSAASPISLTRPGADVLAHDEAEVDAELNLTVGDPDATVMVFFGTSDPGPTAVGWTNPSVNLGLLTDGNISTTLTGLSETTTYFYRFFADDESGNTAWSQARSFTTPLEFPPPILNEVLITDFASPEADVETVLEQADDADVFLVWDSTDKGTGSTGDWANSAVLGNFLFEATVPGTITGLGPNEPVAFRFFATNAFGNDWSELGSFTTPRDIPVLTAYYDFEPDGDPYNDPAGDFADDLTDTKNPLVTPDVPANAKGSTQAADFMNDNYLRTGSFTTDQAADPNAWTLMFWMKALPGDQSSGNTKNMGTREGGVSASPDFGTREWTFDNWGGTNDDPNFYFDFRPTSLSTRWDRRVNNVADGTWRHVTVVNSNLGSPDDGGAYLEIYVDGASQGRDNMDDSWTAFDLSNTGKFSLGNSNGTGGAYFGKYDDVALFAGRVSNADIAAIAAGTKSPADYLPAVGDYAVWAAMFPGADLGDPDADLDADGFTNDEERRFGVDPTDPSSVNPYPTGLFDSTTFTFSYTRRDDSLTGLKYTIETATDAIMWIEDTGAVQVIGDAATTTNGMIETVEVTLSPALLTAPVLQARVRSGEPPTLLSENFESGDGGFTVSTAIGTDWEHGAPDSDGTGGMVDAGNGGSANAWATKLGDFSGTTADPGYYADSTVTCLRSAIIDLTGVAGAELMFAEALDLEQDQSGITPGIVDSAVLNVIDDTTDAIIAAAIYTATDANDTSADWGIANGGNAIDLTPYVGQAIRLEWCLTGFGGDAGDFLGWYIDDVIVTEVIP